MIQNHVLWDSFPSELYWLTVRQRVLESNIKSTSSGQDHIPFTTGGRQAAMIVHVESKIIVAEKEIAICSIH